MVIMTDQTSQTRAWRAALAIDKGAKLNRLIGITTEAALGIAMIARLQSAMM
jgi:hypothetical protein